MTASLYSKARTFNIMNLMIASVAIITFCSAEGKARPHPRPFPQERRARPWFQISPKVEDLVGQLVSSRWKWPLYPEDHPPRLGEWTQGLKGEWIWRDSNISNPDIRNRWKPVEEKKPSGLAPKIAKKPVRKVKYSGPKNQPYHTNYILKNKITMDRIDHFQNNSPSRPFLRPLIISNIVKKPRINNDKISRSPSVNHNIRPINVNNNLIPVNVNNIISDYMDNNIRPVNANINQIKKEFPEKFLLINEKDNYIADKEVDGRKIYMFKGSEGIGSLNYNEIRPNNKVVATPINQVQQTELSGTTLHDFVTPLFTYTTSKTGRRATTTSSRPTSSPPFPTRHTTTAPHQQSHPIIIISQSSVQQNY